MKSPKRRYVLKPTKPTFLDILRRLKKEPIEFDEFLEMIFSQKIKSSEFIMKFLKEDLIVIDKEKTFEKIKNYFL